jgi:hypothetical protein
MAGIYRQRHPEHSVFYWVFFHCFEQFLREYEDRFEKEYGYFRPVIQEVVKKYLDCGNPMCRFARIARVTFHIPDKGQVMIRYYGLYSNAHRGKMRKAGTHPSYPPIIEDGQDYVPSKGWAEIIRKVYEVDPLLCPSCGVRMSVVSFIEDHKVIDRIIRHLELTFEAERPPPPHHIQQELLVAAEESGQYF